MMRVLTVRAHYKRSDVAMWRIGGRITHPNVERLDGPEQAHWLISKVCRCTGVLSSRLLQHDTFLALTSRPEPFFLLRV